MPHPTTPLTKEKRTLQLQTPADRGRRRDGWTDGGVTVYLVEADDVRMLQELHDLHLSEDLFQVLVVQLSLVHYFNRHLETEKSVNRHQHSCQTRRRTLLEVKPILNDPSPSST